MGKNQTAQQYKPRNQPTTHNRQKATKTPTYNPQKQQQKQQKMYKHKPKNFNTTKKRYTTINHQPGTNTLNIASLNPDFFTTNAIQHDIVNQLTQQKYILPPYKKLIYRKTTHSSITTIK